MIGRANVTEKIETVDVNLEFLVRTHGPYTNMEGAGGGLWNALHPVSWRLHYVAIPWRACLFLCRHV